MSDLIAVVLVRGRIGAREQTKDTLDMLNLKKRHTCVILESSPTTIGMCKKTKDFVTFGPIKKETVDELKKARAPVREKPLVFNLAPPRGGWERKGVKKSFSEGGALGKRKEMDSAIKRMM